MVSYDDQTVIRLISELKKAVGRLKALSQLDLQSFLKDPDKVGSAKYHFIVAIESCIDLCNRLIARNRFRAPEDHSDTFTVMAENGVIDATFASEMRKMAKFRNRLVHLDQEVDDTTIHNILSTRLGDFQALFDALSRFVKLPLK